MLAIAAYAALAVFYSGIAWRYFIYTRGGPSPAAGERPATLLAALADIFMLRRVFAANPGIWPGVWAFHISFILVFLGHLRFFFRYAPGWMVYIGKIMPYAGVVLVLSLLYIFVYRLAVEKGMYASAYNLVLTAGFFLLGLTGVLLAEFFLTDVTMAKEFMLGIFSFDLQQPPRSLLFDLHFLTAFALLAFLPTHVFTAPFVTIEARRRQEETRSILHD